jgi:hypothetical protein
VKSEELDLEKVVAAGDALRDGGVVPATSSVHAVNSPLAGGSVEAIAGDLEPLEVGRRGGRGIVNLCHPVLDRTLVRRCDRVVDVVGTLRAAEEVSPEGTDVCTGGDVDHLAGGASSIAGHVGRRDILDRLCRKKCIVSWCLKRQSK